MGDPRLPKGRKGAAKVLLDDLGFAWTDGDLRLWLYRGEWIMPIPRFSISEIADQYIRRNFERLRDHLSQESPLLGFRHFELVFTSPQSHFKLKHNLGFLPKDVILTSQLGSGSVVFNTPLATADSLDLTVSGAITPQTPYTIRFFAGTYQPSGG